MDIMKAYNIIAGIITSQLNCACTASKSQDGQSVVFTINGYPTFPDGVEQDVIVTYPFSWLQLSKSGDGTVEVIANTINFREIRFWQGRIGNPFIHAWVFDDGRPCYGVSSKGRGDTVPEYIRHLILTLRFKNITRDSLKVGSPATLKMGKTYDEILRNTQIQATRVEKKYNLRLINNINFSKWIDDEYIKRTVKLNW